MNTSASAQAVLRVPAEIFHLTSLFIPLHSVATTLRALSLVNRQIRANVKDLIFCRLLLRNEDSALTALQKIRSSPDHGRMVQEIYVLSERSPSTLAQHISDRRFSFLGGLKDIIASGLLPNIVALGVVKQSRWTVDPIPDQYLPEYSLPAEFWNALASKAPRLRRLHVRELADDYASPWVDSDLVAQMTLHRKLSAFHLSIGELDIGIDPGPVKLMMLNAVQLMQDTLQSLTLGPPDIYSRLDNTPLVNLNFRCLHSIELHGFKSPNVSTTMQFWTRHTGLEQVILWYCSGDWFDPQPSANLLPKLTHLKAGFKQVRGAAAVIYQLRSLCIFNSYNMQIPYLLTCVLDTTLTNLRSLEFQQVPDNDSVDEGSDWLPTHLRDRTGLHSAFDAEYMQLIARACPNLEELGFLGQYLWERGVMERIGSALRQLSHLRHMYYPLGYAEVSGEQLLDVTRQLAEVCPRLESNAHLRKGDPPVVAFIVRDTQGAVEEVVVRDRWAMDISVYGDDPFPETQAYFRHLDV